MMSKRHKLDLIVHLHVICKLLCAAYAAIYSCMMGCCDTQHLRPPNKATWMVEMMTSQDPPLMHDLQYDKQYMSIIKPAWSYLWTKSDSISFTTQSSTLLVTKRNPEAITMKLKLLALLLLQLAMSISAPLPASMLPPRLSVQN